MARHLVTADIHSNIVALDAVLEAIGRDGGFEEWWVLGDIVGYGPAPVECVRRVRDAPRCVCVAGNHDCGVVGSIELSRFNEGAARACRWTRSKLPASEKRFLEGLPTRERRGPFLLTHGSPREPVWEYIVSAQQVRAVLPQITGRHCLVGHTHVPAAWVVTDASGVQGLAVRSGTRLELAGARFLINPGAVGQPRDGDPRAAYAVYDDEGDTMTFHRVAYDVNSVSAAVRAEGLPEWLGFRLHLGY